MTKNDMSFDDLLDGKFPAFKDFKTTKLGDVGEEMIADWLINTKSPIAITSHDYPNHDFDYELETRTKRFYGEVKTKVIPFRKFPKSVGIDKKDWIKYQSLDLDLYLFIIDVPHKVVYGQWISKLKDKHYFEMATFDTQTIVLFKIRDFKKLFDLTETQINQLTKDV